MIAAASPFKVTSEQAGRTADDHRQFFGVVEVELTDEAEAVAQRCGDQSGSRRRADQREVRQVKSNGARRRSAADHDVETTVLHGRVENLFHAPR